MNRVVRVLLACCAFLLLGSALLGCSQKQEVSAAQQAIKQQKKDK